MKIAYLWGANFSNTLSVLNIKNGSFYILMPENEPLFPQATQEPIKKVLGNKAINVPYDSNKIAEQLLTLEADVIISMGWRRILGSDFFKLLENRLVINVHPAILPQYKGYHTEPYVIINEEHEHGITAHYLTPELDDGKIIHQLRFPISRFSTTASIKMQAHELMPQFLNELMSLIHRDLLTGTEQDPSLTKIVAPKRSPEDSEIDPTQPLIALYNSIRACDSKRYPAFFYLDGQKVFISLARAANTEREHPLEL